MYHEDDKSFLVFGKQLNQIIAILQMVSTKNPDIQKLNEFIQYLKDTRGELKHVSWPTQKQTTIFTILVIVLSLIVAFYLGVLDYVLTGVLNRVI